MSGCSRCCFYIFIILAEILLHGVVALCLYWIVQYRWDGEGLPFTWPGTEEADLEKLWNLHPVLMVTGLIYCLGQGILLHSLSFRLFRIFPGIIMYWSCSCGLQICSKLMYILFHLLGIPCVVLGFLSIWTWKDQSASPHLYSIHSWLGLVTMGLAAVQVGQPDSCKTASKIFFSAGSRGHQLSPSTLLPVCIFHIQDCHGPCPPQPGHHHLHPGHGYGGSWHYRDCTIQTKVCFYFIRKGELKKYSLHLELNSVT